MSRTFAYARVSTQDQTAENQLLIIANAGHVVLERRVRTETISGTTPAMARPVFKQLMMELEQDDILVVAKLDRLGRGPSDVESTIELLQAKGVRVIALDLPGGITELTSAAGNLIRGMILLFAKFERDQLVERTLAGLARARAEGKTLGRKDALAEIAKKRRIERSVLVDEIRAKIAAGGSVRAVGKEYGVSHPTIIRAMQANGAG